MFQHTAHNDKFPIIILKQSYLKNVILSILFQKLPFNAEIRCIIGYGNPANLAVYLWSSHFWKP